MSNIDLLTATPEPLYKKNNNNDNKILISPYVSLNTIAFPNQDGTAYNNYIQSENMQKEYSIYDFLNSLIQNNGTIDDRFFKYNTISGTKIKSQGISGSTEYGVPNQIKLKSIRKDDIADNTIDTINIKDKAINSEKIQDKTIDTINIKDKAINSEKIQDKTINQIHLQDNICTDIYNIINLLIKLAQVAMSTQSEPVITQSDITNMQTILTKYNRVQ